MGGDYAKSPRIAQETSSLRNKEAIGISLIKKDLRRKDHLIRLPIRQPS
jgi:hypothetical protein